VLGPLAEIIAAESNKRQMRNAPSDSRLRPGTFGDIKFFGTIAAEKGSAVVLGSFGSCPNLSSHSFTLSAIEGLNIKKSVLVDIEVSRLLAASSVNLVFVPKLLATIRHKNSFHEIYDVPLVSSCQLLVNLSGLPESTLTYIAANMVSAIDFIQSHGIVYRNVNPENLFLDSAGRIIFIDNRFCKIGVLGTKSFTICGSVEYLAPEQLVQTGHGSEVDLWSLGVSLYEIAVGEQPFAASSEIAVLSKITSFGSSSFPSLNFPETLPTCFRSLISGLVMKTPKERLGSNNNFRALKSHQIFEKLDFFEIANPSYESPLKDLASRELEAMSSQSLETVLNDAWNAEYNGELSALFET
jgi:serine/threonine protein kinase